MAITISDTYIWLIIDLSINTFEWILFFFLLVVYIEKLRYHRYRVNSTWWLSFFAYVIIRPSLIYYPNLDLHMLYHQYRTLIIYKYLYIYIYISLSSDLFVSSLECVMLKQIKLCKIKLLFFRVKSIWFSE